ERAVPSLVTYRHRRVLASVGLVIFSYPTARTLLPHCAYPLPELICALSSPESDQYLSGVESMARIVCHRPGSLVLLVCQRCDFFPRPVIDNHIGVGSDVLGYCSVLLRGHVLPQGFVRTA